MSKETVFRSPLDRSPAISRRLLLGAAAAGAFSAAGCGNVQSAVPAKPKLDLSLYELTFAEEFDDPNFDMEAFNKRWYAHTPWHGDFGDAQFTDPRPGFPFMVDNGNLTIVAEKGQDGKWRSGLISSLNHEGVGFAQQYGYFECRCRMPPGPGVWPAFWLDSWYPGMTDPSIEIDVFEYYGKFPTDIHSTVTVWPKNDLVKKTSEGHIHKVEGTTLTDEFHVYGVSVDPDWVAFYFDGQETWRTPTPATHKHPLVVLCNLALGSGWPIDETINPSFFTVDYIRVYKLKNT
ncbi:glycoside hydrolase family 16 protein [Asticcacaulis sp.]|uniref:glycoside hydrolase family 16 protein n=1 Tax=Asticcacaulis sp. TaxID=1872648 RepID=UPI003919C752